MAQALPRHHRVPITIRVESFEGPLDLLLYLIQSHELRVDTVSIEKVTHQYLNYVTRMQELNFDVASEFLVMAATLLLWKSKSVLPEEKDPTEEEEDDALGLTKEDLVRQLLEHQRYLQAGDQIAELPRFEEDIFARPNHRPPIEKVWKEMNVTDLSLSYQDLMRRSRKRKQILRKETVSISEKMLEFKHLLKLNEVKILSDLIRDKTLRGEVVVTFLSSLELSRLKKLLVNQHEIYGPIYLELIESLENFDVSAATGFDDPDETKETPKDEATTEAVQTETSKELT